MFKLLSVIFIKDRENYKDARVRRAYGRLSSIYGICINLLLFVGKYFAGMISGSLAIVADAFNNLSDAMSSVITLFGFILSGKEPDVEHPFGHGRLEYIVGMALSVIIIFTGGELFKESFDKIFHPSEIAVNHIVFIIMGVCVLAKVYMFVYNNSVAKKIESEVMSAVAKDSLSDCIATSVVIVAMIIKMIFNFNIDGYAGVLVAGFIIFSGLESLKDTVSPLLGKAPTPEFVEEIEKIVLSHDQVKGIHDLIVHDYGPGRRMITLHAEVDGHSNMFETHDVIDLIESELNEEFGCIATIHMDPIESDNPIVNELRAKVESEVKLVDERITIHDFRIVPGPTHTNLIFDALVPVDYRKKDHDIAEEIREIINENNKEYFAVVSIDRAYASKNSFKNA